MRRGQARLAAIIGTSRDSRSWGSTCAGNGFFRLGGVPLRQNAMGELENAGVSGQPHTSAGRWTDKGYRTT